MKRSIFALALFPFLLVGCNGNNTTEDSTEVKYNLQFNANGGEGSMDSEKHKEGEQFNLPACTFTYDRYGFNGWATSADGDIEYVDQSPFTMPGTDKTLFAKWEFLGYNITFDANGGEGSMDAVTVKEGTLYTLPKSTFTLHNYHMSGWSLSATGAKAYDDEEEITMVGEDITLFAKWEFLGYTLSFNGNGGTGSIDDTNYLPGDTVILPESTYQYVDKVFIGWSTSNDPSNIMEAGSEFVMPSSDCTLFANWIDEEAVIHFDANGGEGTMDDLVTTVGASVTLPQNIFTHSTKAFGGWALTSSGNVAYKDKATITVPLKNEITLYAVWGVRQTAEVHHNTYYTTSAGNRWAVQNDEYTYISNAKIDDLIEAFGVPTPDDGSTFVGYREREYKEIINSFTFPNYNSSSTLHFLAQLINFDNFDRYTEIVYDYSAAKTNSSAYSDPLKVSLIVSIHNTLDKIVVDWGDGTDRTNYGSNEFLFGKEDKCYILEHTFSSLLDVESISIKIAGAIDSIAVYRENGEYVSYGHKYFTKLFMCDDIRNIKPFNGTYGAFEGCENLQNVQVSDNADVFGACAFKDCTRLNNLYIPGKRGDGWDLTSRVSQKRQQFNYDYNYISAIGDEAFANLTNLRTLMLPGINDNIQMGHGIVNGFNNSGTLFAYFSQNKANSKFPSDWRISGTSSTLFTTYFDVDPYYVTLKTLSHTLYSGYPRAVHVLTGYEWTFAKKNNTDGNYNRMSHDGTVTPISSWAYAEFVEYDQYFFLIYSSSGTTNFLVKY